MDYNSRLLLQQLTAAGVSCYGCNSVGVVFFNDNATDDDKAKAQQVLDSYTDPATEVKTLGVTAVSALAQPINELDYVYQIFQYLSGNGTDLGQSWQDWQSFKNQ